MVSVHDAEALGISNGQMLKVSTRRGEIEIAAFVTKRMQKGVVFIPFHFVESPVNRLTTTATDPHAKILSLRWRLCVLIPFVSQRVK